MLTATFNDIYTGAVYPLMGGFSTASTASQTLITIPAGRYWSGTLNFTCSVAEDAAGTSEGSVLVTMTVVGSTGSVPANGANVLAGRAVSGANAAGGTTGSQSSTTVTVPYVMYAGASGTLAVSVSATISGTNGRADAFAVGLVF